MNNNAAAVLLAVNTFAEGLEVIVSRGELVEIGGSFRIPDVLRKSGAVLREVGTTNRTRAADYRAALGPATGMILKVHPSNFRIVGFAEAPSRAELAAVAAEAKVPLVEDLGSGLLAPLPPPLDREETVADVAAGRRRRGDVQRRQAARRAAGGGGRGQGGGRSGPCAANPLYRALRVDKMTLAALDAVLREYQEGRAAGIPDGADAVGAGGGAAGRARRPSASAWSGTAPGASADVVDGRLRGGRRRGADGGDPDRAACACATGRTAPHELARRLRLGEPAVVARIVDDAVVLDLRTVDAAEEDALLAAVAAASAS